MRNEKNKHQTSYHNKTKFMKTKPRLITTEAAISLNVKVKVTWSVNFNCHSPDAHLRFAFSRKMSLRFNKKEF